MEETQRARAEIVARAGKTPATLAAETRVHDAWGVIVSASAEQGIEMLSGTPSFAIGVTHDGALIQQCKTYPDGSQRFGCPPFPMESPIQQKEREYRERLEREAREAEYRHMRQMEWMKQQERERENERKAEKMRFRIQNKAIDTEIERWFLTELPTLIVPMGKRGKK